MPRTSHWLAALVACCARAALAAPADAPASELELRLAELRRPEPVAGEAIVVKSLRFASGPGGIELESGSLWPLTRAGGRVVEWVFVGRGRLRLEPPDAIEAGQLDLFTGARTFDEAFTSGVFVIAHDGAGKALESRPKAAPDADAQRRAVEAAESWRASAERRLLEVEGNLLADALGDRLFDGFFAARLEGETLGRFLYVVDPEETEQVTLGKFHPLDVSAREKRKIERAIGSEQREGRLLGERFEDLGEFDNWVSATLAGSDGSRRAGTSSFEPAHYEIEVAIDDRGEQISGRMSVDLVKRIAGASVASFRVHPDEVVERVADGLGAPLASYREGATLLVRLPAEAPAGERVRVALDFRGRLIERESGRIALRDTIYWHPHAGTQDRATYDVTLRWPRRLELVAGGRSAEPARAEGDTMRARRLLERPSAAFGFEVGRYDGRELRRRRRAGHSRLRPRRQAAAPRFAPRSARRSATASTTSSRTYGPYPFAELAVVTTPRPESQALPGLVTLSSLMMADLGWLGQLLGFEDRRTIVAHEVAHQWWGHDLGWKSYRDQWISEAMANYAALAWSRARLPADQRPAVGPTSGWQEYLLAETREGRTVESLGPVVLGRRLFSTKSDSAYAAIVYTKGALILDMLANAVGQENFADLLGAICRQASGKLISTEDFLTLLERGAGTELDELAARYVYGTGMPEVLYEYRLSPAAAENGKWVVEGSARQVVAYRWRWRLERREDGELVPRRLQVAQTDAQTDVVVTPFQVGIYEAASAKDSERRKAERGEAPVANKMMRGRLAIRGEATPFRFEIDHRPVEFWLDRDGEAFASFVDARRSPKLAEFVRGQELAARDDRAGAATAWRSGLAAEYEAVRKSSAAPVAAGERKSAARRLDARLHLALAELALDAGDTAGAERELEAADDAVGLAGPGLLEGWFDLVEGRLALARGDAAAAYRKLRKTDAGWAEASLFRALAARAAGRTADFRAAIAEAKERGADVSALGAEAPN